MISANVQQQQQQVDNKKATNANYNRKSQINLALYTQSSNNRNIFSENNYCVPKDYNSTFDLSGNELLSPQTQNINSNSSAPLSIASNILAADSATSANILNDQISALFPKCRPKNDANLNKTSLYIETNNTVLASASLLLASSPSNGDYKNQNKSFGDSESPENTLIDNSGAYTRNMNNQNADASVNDGNSEHMQSNISGINESASRMNHAGYATRLYQHKTNINSNSNYQRSANGQHQSNEYLGGFEGSNQMSKMHQKWENPSNDIRKWTENEDFLRDGNIWEKRRRTPNTTPASTVLNSPDFNEMHHYTHNPVQHQIKVGRSPVNQHEHNKEKSSASPVSPIQSYQRSTKRPATLVSDGEIVVFDDIDNWRNQNEKHFITQSKQSQQQNYSNSKSQSSHRFNHMLFDDDDDDDDERINDSNTNTFSTENVTKMIGILPIAEYEGSPRRFGLCQQDLPLHQYQYTSNTNQQHFERPPSSRKMLTSPTLFPPRPGFPKRITTSPSNGSINGTMADENNKSNSATGFEYQNNTLHKLSPSVSPTQITSSPIIPNKRVITSNSNSPTNSQAVPISPPSPLENEGNSIPVSDTNAKKSPNYTDRINLLSSNVTAPNTTTFDYLYEFSETRKVLEDFFKCPTNDEEKKIADCFNESDTGSLENINEIDEKNAEANYIGQRLAKVPTTNNKDYNNTSAYQSPKSRYTNNYSNQQSDEYETNDVELYLDSNSRSSGELADTELEMNQQRRYSRHFTLSPETTDYDSNCGDLDSLSNDLNGCIGMNSHCLAGSGLNSSNAIIPDYSRLYTSMPVLEDGLSSGHASDTENNNPVPYPMNNISTTTNNTITTSAQINNIFDSKYIATNMNSMGKMLNPTPVNSMPINASNANQPNNISLVDVSPMATVETAHKEADVPKTIDGFGMGTIGLHINQKQQQQSLTQQQQQQQQQQQSMTQQQQQQQQQQQSKEEKHVESKSYLDSDITSIFSNPPLAQMNTAHNNTNISSYHEDHIEIAHSTLKDIRNSMQQSKPLQPPTNQQQQQQQQQKQHEEDKKVKNEKNSPIWLPRHHHGQHNQSRESLNSDHNPSKPLSVDDEEADTDLETDRLLGQQRLDDHGFYDDKSSNNWCDRPSRLIKSPSASLSSKTIQPQQHHAQTFSSASIRQGIGTSSASGIAAACANNSSSLTSSPPNQQSSNQHQPKNPSVGNQNEIKDGLTSPNKSHLSKVQKSPSDSQSSKNDTDKIRSGKSRNKEGRYWEPAVLIEGVLFRARYLGSTQLVCEGQPTKSTRMMQAEEAVSRIKAPEGETQPSTEVDLFISTEKIMVLNTDLKEIMMDHALRTISYIADIGDLVVLMARRRFVPSDTDDGAKLNRTPKMICHVFESDEAQFIAQSIGQAFQVAYMEFLKANGIEDHSFVKEMDYQEVLNSQEIFGDELEIFAKKELQKEVVVPKTKGEILGMILIESGWGSMLPTVVIANLLSTGAAARCGQLNIGDQIIAINGLSLVGLPLSTCQTYIRNTKNQTAVKFTVVPCPPVVEVKIKRPNTKYQLGFSVQNGVICSLLRGGIAERGGVRVGHRIIEINNQSVVAVPHEKIVNLLATSVGEILMKTMPTSMFRLLTGQENPVYI